MAEMTCPKCRGAMHTYERNGIHVEQCTECRGLFLDRGELEHLVAAEARWQAAPAAPAAPAPAQPAPQQYAPPPQQYSGGHAPYHKRKKSFLEELFD